MTEQTGTQGTQVERLQASLKDFVADRDYFERVSNQHYDKWQEAEEEIENLKQLNSVLLKGLEWYAGDQYGNVQFFPPIPDIPILHDCGKLAQNVIKTIQK